MLAYDKLANPGLSQGKIVWIVYKEIGRIYFLMESIFIIYIHYYDNRSFLTEIFI